MSTLAIGDIHGCHKALVTLLGELDAGANDQIVFLGDYIDRGPDSHQVMDLLIDHAKARACIFLRGNHEEMVLEARHDPLKSNLWPSYGGLETLYSYGAQYREEWASLIPEAHWSFWEKTIRVFETKTNLFVHACLDPDLDADEQPGWLAYWESFEKIQPHKSGKKIICGHTVQKSGRINDLGFAACIDTAAATGGWLTCLHAESGCYWQANEKGETRRGRLGNL